LCQEQVKSLFYCRCSVNDTVLIKFDSEFLIIFELKIKFDTSHVTCVYDLVSVMDGLVIAKAPFLRYLIRTVVVERNALRLYCN
jgi:hypothetical protein